MKGMNTFIAFSFLIFATLVIGHPHPSQNEFKSISNELSRKVSQMARRNVNANHCDVKVSEWNKKRRLQRRTLTQSSESYGDQGEWSTPNKYGIVSSDQIAPPPDLERLKESIKNSTKPQYDHIMDKVAVLAPEGITGPYYIGYGNQIRQNITESQVGIPLILDIGLINIQTCQPFPNVMVDVWHANATGFYSGFTQAKPYGFVNAAPVTETRNGSRGLLGALTTSRSDNLTFLRGLWPSNENGIAEFHTIMPGKYDGRAVHIHLKTFSNYTLLNNGSISGHDGQSGIIHTGQVYFPDFLMLDTFNTTNYLANRNPFTPNRWDPVYPQETQLGSDPLVHWEKMGDKLEDGVIAYSTLAIDPDVSDVKL